MLKAGAAQQQANFVYQTFCIRQKSSVFVNISFFQLSLYICIENTACTAPENIFVRRKRQSVKLKKITTCILQAES